MVMPTQAQIDAAKRRVREAADKAQAQRIQRQARIVRNVSAPVTPKPVVRAGQGALTGTGTRPTIPGGPAEMMTPAPIGRGAVARPVNAPARHIDPTVTGYAALQPLGAPAAQAPMTSIDMPALPRPRPNRLASTSAEGARIALDVRTGQNMAEGMNIADAARAAGMAATTARLPQGRPPQSPQPVPGSLASTSAEGARIAAGFRKAGMPARMAKKKVVAKKAAARKAATAAAPPKRVQITNNAQSAFEFARQGQAYLRKLHGKS